ncbi:hypothetical protein JMA_17620 [Jeotgalibacillus malaysiensis]|uniref:Uncharacterized protein n=1 Tax=Jeotgalibacillus malaysiensis TaxID=1508404 RepID=A0A0B5ASS5_9BACL|nr:hypothetical protein JMA_17620 [Jeotgalibacillus malaysiensis]
MKAAQFIYWSCFHIFKTCIPEIVNGLKGWIKGKSAVNCTAEEDEDGTSFTGLF